MMDLMIFNKRKKFFIILVTFFLSIICGGNVLAIITPHPIQMYERGVFYLEKYQGDSNDLLKAEETFVDLIEEYPESPLGYLGMSRTYIIDAYLYHDRYDMLILRDHALPFAVKALEFGSSLREVHEIYSFLEGVFEKHHRRLKEVQNHLSADSEDTEINFGIANFMNEQSDVTSALKYYARALNQVSESHLKEKILKRIALIYLTELQDPKMAAGYYQQILEIKADLPEVHEYLGLALLMMEKYNLAVEHLEKALNSVDSPMTRYYLAQAQGCRLEEGGLLAQAIVEFEKTNEYRSYNSFLHYKLGNLYFQTKKFDKAYKHFRNVIDLRPDESKAYYFAGRAAHSLGKKAMALDYYEQYLKLKTDGQEADWIRENISEVSHRLE